jgi:electron transfer flavoprotein beta subunit
MRIAVLLAGVADPKKPLPKPASGDWRDLRADPAVSYKLSPFDEAALEIALKLRDQIPGTEIAALVTDGSGDATLMRTVAALRVDHVRGLAVPAAQRGNPAWLARHAADALWKDEPAPDLVLVGREHGDLDDGMTPAYLAEAWQLPYAALALQARAGESGGWSFLRGGTTQDEWLHLPSPALAGVSNDKSNRLRHPLMKNVALAKQQRFEIAAPTADEPAARTTLAHAAPAQAAARGGQACRMIEGTVQDQARALAAWLQSHTTQGDAHAGR